METLYLTCVLIIASNTPGIVTSRTLHDQKTGEDWVLVETMDGEVTAGVKELKGMPCSETNVSKFKNFDHIKELMGI